MQTANRKKINNRTPLAIQLEAKRLIMVEGKNQKETAKILGFTEKTIGAWCRENNWNRAKGEVLSADNGANSLLGFMLHIHETHPEHFPLFEQLHTEYTHAFNRRIIANAKRG